jgi:hypothetical protein
MLIAIAAGLVIQAAGPASAHEITIYNQGFGLVKETRQFDLKPGRQTVEVKDVAEQIEPNSVGIKSLTSPNDFQVLEQNYQYDLISTQAILNKSVGQKIRFIRHFGATQEVLEGTLISAPYAVVADPNGYSNQTYNGMVIKTDDGRIVLNPTGEVEVSSVPPGMISVPTLLWDLQAGKSGPQNVELSYLTKGINWNADYVLTLSTDSKADLQGWVTIDNQCGATFTDAKLKLLAGDVRRIQPQNGGFAGGGAGRFAKSEDAAQFQQENLFEYHLYTLQRPATLKNRETKQISLLQGTGVKFEKKLIIDSLHDVGQYYPSEGEVGTGDLKPLAQIEFVNSKANGLGMPMPKGTVKVYQRDSSGSVQMLGEDAIDHTPKDETITLAIGRSFDIVASRKRMNFRRLGPSTFQETFEINVRNRKDVGDTVHVYERHYGDWKVNSKSMDYTKLDAWTMDFVVNLKAGESKTITYTVTTQW